MKKCARIPQVQQVRPCVILPSVTPVMTEDDGQPTLHAACPCPCAAASDDDRVMASHERMAIGGGPFVHQGLQPNMEMQIRLTTRSSLWNLSNTIMRARDHGGGRRRLRGRRGRGAAFHVRFHRRVPAPALRRGRGGQRRLPTGQGAWICTGLGESARGERARVAAACTARPSRLSQATARRCLPPRPSRRTTLRQTRPTRPQHPHHHPRKKSA